MIEHHHLGALLRLTRKLEADLRVCGDVGEAVLLEDDVKTLREIEAFLRSQMPRTETHCRHNVHVWMACRQCQADKTRTA